MIKIRLENARSRITDAKPDELRWIREYMTYRDSRRFFANEWAKKNEKKYEINPYVCMLDKQNSFPTGLFSLMKDAMYEEGFRFAVTDAREAPCEWDLTADVEWLYDYQFEAVEKAYEEKVGIIKLATGSGKAEIAVGLAKAIPCHWLFLVHRSGLVHDVAERWKKHTGMDAGIIEKGGGPDPNRRFSCATFQVFVRRMRDPVYKRLLADVEGLIVDEAHTAAADSFFKIAMATRRAYWRIGLSGTPLDRKDNRSVAAAAVLGKIIYTVPTKLLIQRGILATPIIRFLELEQDIHSSGWQEAYRSVIVDSKVRNARAIDMAIKCAKPAFVFVRQVKHGKMLTALLNKAGVRAEFCWGQKGDASRSESIKRLRYGELDVIVCSVVFQEGVDVPELESVVNAAGMDSTIAALQRIGRGMRSNKGKKLSFEVWDFLDTGNRFMERHAKSRKKAFISEGHEVQIVQSV